MANKDIEIEIKFPLQNQEEVIGFLDKNAELVSRNDLQKDTYFIPVHRNFVGVKYPFEWLRLRETLKGSSVNYKHFYPENVKKTDYCDEFETKLHDAGALRKIFRSLDFKELIVVDKKRSIWNFKDAEIAIDDVKGLGSFIELEAKKDYDDSKEGKKHLYKVLNLLNAKVGEEDLRGYPFLILERKSGSGFADKANLP
ncbi:MAG TPA: class IV adenylate cyclase [Candidatus Nanoarchaeia archaeon]|nr:class IV adenylate cyclase [Candidatus Nanoarchaeia archaeon]